MKKICFITTISLTLKSFVLETAKYLHENTDWDISFICSSDDKFAEEIPEYIHLYPIRMERGISILGIKAMLQMYQVFRKEKFDLIQYSTPNASLYASFAGWFARVPVRLYCQWGMVYVGFSGIKRSIFKTEEKLVCRLSTWIEPDSHSNLKFAHRERLYPENKGSVIWNGSACGVNLNKFAIAKKSEYRRKIRSRYGIGEGTVVYGFVGRITRDKGINELMASFKKLSTKYEDICLMMVGSTENDGTVSTELIQWAKQEKKVIFTGFTNFVEQYLSAIDVYILPSYREGFGMGVVEAEAMGVPVIVSNIPGPTDAMIPGETGIVVEKKDIEMLVQAMEELYNDKNKRTLYGKNAQIYAVKAFEQQMLFAQILADRMKLLNN